jgi:methionyl aminopeptidase
MIRIKSPSEIKKMRTAGKLAAEVLQYIQEYVVVGQNTGEIDRLCHEFIVNNGAIPAPLNYHGFPKSICTSVNNIVCHGIPDPEQILEDGDIVNVDVTVILDGYHGDTSKTYMVGNVKESTKLLVERTENAMMRGIQAIKPNSFLYEVGKSIEKYVNKFGYSIVRDYGGPHVYHFYTPANRIRLRPGMTFTVEPMIIEGDYEVITSQTDGWTVTTKDNSLTAQFEHTVLVTPKGYEILTKV